MNNNDCPRCGGSRLQSWTELDNDEQEVVRRLPMARDYELEERKKKHVWCTRCWYESTGDVAQA